MSIAMPGRPWLNAVRVLRGVFSFLVRPLLELVGVVLVVPFPLVDRAVWNVTHELHLPVSEVCLVCPAHPRLELLPMLLGGVDMAIRQLFVPLAVLALPRSEVS